jgi:NAD(P)-dependent dehydrogenase (short-subunit alcohol dehydrogenase family)
VSRKTVVITGASSEGARAAAVAALSAGAQVVLVSRHLQACTTAREEVASRAKSEHVHLLVADLALQSSTRELARQLLDGFPTVHALIHHGVYHQMRATTREVTEEGFERFWAYNHLGPFLLTHLLKDALTKAKGRVITIGATRLKVYPRLQVNVEDPNFERRSFNATRAFYQSKLAQIQFALALERHWKGSGVLARSLSIPVLGVDPLRRSSLPWYRRLALTTARQDGLTIQRLGEVYTVAALAPGVAKLPVAYVDHRFEAAWAPVAAFDQAQQDATWALSARSVGL